MESSFHARRTHATDCIKYKRANQEHCVLIALSSFPALSCIPVIKCIQYLPSPMSGICRHWYSASPYVSIRHLPSSVFGTCDCRYIVPATNTLVRVSTDTLVRVLTDTLTRVFVAGAEYRQLPVPYTDNQVVMGAVVKAVWYH
ncbi:hypothetical protein [Prevotella nigrescens]|uniref:hypothetical protein n=1 Tax=Prevotella nigrescens TaxID=28133 RepID=UPI00360CF416